MNSTLAAGIITGFPNGPHLKSKVLEEFILPSSGGGNTYCEFAKRPSSLTCGTTPCVWWDGIRLCVSFVASWPFQLIGFICCICGNLVGEDVPLRTPPADLAAALARDQFGYDMLDEIQVRKEQVVNEIVTRINSGSGNTDDVVAMEALLRLRGLVDINELQRLTIVRIFANQFERGARLPVVLQGLRAFACDEELPALVGTKGVAVIGRHVPLAGVPVFSDGRDVVEQELLKAALAASVEGSTPKILDCIGRVGRNGIGAAVSLMQRNDLNSRRIMTPILRKQIETLSLDDPLRSQAVAILMGRQTGAGHGAEDALSASGSQGKRKGDEFATAGPPKSGNDRHTTMSGLLWSIAWLSCAVLLGLLLMAVRRRRRR